MWRVISGMSAFLEKAIKDDFHAYFERLYGTRRETPRWQFCLQSTRLNLGLPLSMLYIDEKFGETQMKHVRNNNHIQPINWKIYGL